MVLADASAEDLHGEFPPNRPSRAPGSRRSGRILLVVVAIAIVGRCRPHRDERARRDRPLSAGGRDRPGRSSIRDLYTIVFLIAVAIFFLVEGLILWTVLRYRRKPERRHELPAQTHGNAIAEVVWTVVPTLIVAFLFVISWQTLNTVEVVSADPQTRIKAVAGQFQWTFEYLDADAARTRSTRSSCRPVRTAAWCSRPAGRSS